MAAAAMIPHVNRIVGNPDDAENYGLARAALAGAGSVREAVDAAGLLGDQPADVQADARAELDALPADVDRQILESLRGALDRGAPIEVRWTEVEAGTPISHQASETGGVVHIEIVAPHGRHFRV
jgi:hypothetical protein